MQFSAGQDIRLTNDRARSSFYPWPLSIAPRGINISISIQLHDPCTIGKLSIRRVKICNFSKIGRKTEEKERLKVQKMTLGDERTWSLYCA